jgi:hypothetical protein
LVEGTAHFRFSPLNLIRNGEGMMMRKKVVSLFNLAGDQHSEVCRFTIKEGIPVDQINCNYVSNLIVLQNRRP